MDQYRLNRKSYTKHFLQDYHALQKKIEQGADTTDAVKNEDNSLAENSDIEDLGIEVDDEYSDMDLLELLSRDIDIEGGEKQTKTKSAPKKMHESTDGMPLCFSCKNMVDCPKGLDSSQMESCMKCDAYEDMNRDSGASASAEEESGMPLCFSCSNMIDCPRGIDSNQMETIFSCKDFQDMNAPAESQEEKTPICFNCSNMINCPRGIDSSQMETIFECKQYRDINEPTLVSKTEGGNSSDSQKSIVLETTASEGDLLSSILSRRTEDREADEKHAKEEEEAKQNRIAEIMKEWEKSKGELKVFCKKCETEMQKVVTQKKVYYQCKNYPECLIRGDEWYVKKATEKRIITQKIKADLIKLYQFDETKNIVSISEIYSEGKLFL